MVLLSLNRRDLANDRMIPRPGAVVEMDGRPHSRPKIRLCIFHVLISPSQFSLEVLLLCSPGYRSVITISLAFPLACCLPFTRSVSPLSIVVLGMGAVCQGRCGSLVSEGTCTVTATPSVWHSTFPSGRQCRQARKLKTSLPWGTWALRTGSAEWFPDTLPSSPPLYFSFLFNWGFFPSLWVLRFLSSLR